MRNGQGSRHSFFRVVAKAARSSAQASPGAFVAYLASSVAFTALLLADLHLTRTLIDSLPEAASSGAVEVAWRIALAALALGAADVAFMLANAAMNYSFESLAAKGRRALDERVSAKASGLNLIRFESAAQFDEIALAVRGASRGVHAFDQFACSLIFHGGYFIGFGLYVASQDPILVPIVAACFVPTALARIAGARARAKAEREAARPRREAEEAESALCDSPRMKETRTLGASGFFASRLERAMGEWSEASLRHEGAAIRTEALLKAASFASYALFIAYATHSVASGRLAPGLYGATFFALSNIFKWFDELLERMGDSMSNAALAADCFRFLDEQEAGGSGAPSLPGAVALESASFAYPGTGRPAIDGVSLSISPGETVAVVGENGAGKSTLVKLLAGLLVPDRGRALVGGVDSRTFAEGRGRAGVSAAFQDAARYPLSLLDNVCVSDATREPDRARAADALSRAGFGEGRRPLDSVLSREFGGADLSGGEWQRVALARCLYRTGELVILDEPTSAVDPLEETRLYRRFAEIARGRAAVLVTHRLGAARVADRIIVLRAGRIIEEGTHDALMASGGEYATMFSAQAARYSFDGPGGRFDGALAD
jgi:ATP-binding cassette subfamily B protein